MTAGELFSKAVQSTNFIKGPCFEHEGIAGYIETDVEFIINDLRIFTNLWEAWYTLSSIQRTNLYGLAKGLGDRK